MALQVVLLIDYENVHWTMVREYHLEPEISRLLEALKGEAEKYTAVEDLLGIIPAKRATAPPVQMDQSISVETIVAKLSGAEGRLNFVAVSHFLSSIVEGDFSAKSLAFNKAVERGPIDLYQIPNPKNPQYPTKCCRLRRDNPRVAELLNPS